MMNLKRKIYNPSRKCEKMGPMLAGSKFKQFYIGFVTNMQPMGSKALQRASSAITNEQFISMRAKLKKLGFGSMRDVTQGSALKLQVPTGFPGANREVLTKSAGKSVARFVFCKSHDLWNLELTLSRPSDLRSGLLVEAYPGKKHKVERKTYEASLEPLLDEERAVAHIDDLNVFLAGIDDDREISEAVDAQKIKRSLKAMGKSLEDENSMVEDFLAYVAGFITHCDELWAWQIQRLKMDSNAKAIMGMIADKV
jgi:hypothetical protein